MNYSARLITLGCVLWCVSAKTGEAMEETVYKDAARPIEERLDDLVGRLTFDEKILLVSGKSAMDTADIPRLGIPSLKMTDGPHGVGWNQSTCFPSGIGMAATWNPGLIERMCAALAEETRGQGRNVQLGPCINICRTPLNGRNFEAFGEDPYLVSRLAVAYIKGIQGQGIGTSVKHFALNNQEKGRFDVSVEADERTLREIYLPAFKAAVVEAGAQTVMTAHNRFRGTYCSANDYLQNQILKGEWGFQGLTVCDWGGIHDTVAAANGGCDLEMPGPARMFGDALKAAVKEGKVSQAAIDDKIRRILRVAMRLGLFEPATAARKGAVGTPEHLALAREVAREAITLLKNEGGALPLDAGAIRTLAVIGPNAAEGRGGGGGSSTVHPPFIVSPLDGIRKRCGGKIEVRFVEGVSLPNQGTPVSAEALLPPGASEGEHGLLGEYFANRNLEGEPVFARVDRQVDFEWTEDNLGGGIRPDSFSVRWTGKLVVPEDGEYMLGTVSDDGSRLYFDGKLIVDMWRDQPRTGRMIRMHLEKSSIHELRMEYFQAGGAALTRLAWDVPSQNVAKAVAVARDSDAAVVFIGLDSTFEGEDCDRTDMNLPLGQAELIEAVAAANPKTAVVFIGGSPFVMEPWIRSVPALVCAWYPGQEGGHAIAEVLFGDVNPSGKLPLTLPKRIEDNPSHGNYTWTDTENYAEGLLVGYRHYDTKGVEPQFPFGHGLSYTEFRYDSLQIDPATLTVSFDIENVGQRPGREVAQLYIRDIESSLPRPAKELKRFLKAELKPGEKQTVTLALDEEALSFYDPEKKAWVAEPGEFEILVGSSSRDIRLTGSLTLEPPAGM